MTGAEIEGIITTTAWCIAALMMLYWVIFK